MKKNKNSIYLTPSAPPVSSPLLPQKGRSTWVPPLGGPSRCLAFSPRPNLRKTSVEQEDGVSFTCRAISWEFVNKNRQLGILRQNFHLVILLSYSSYWTQQGDGFGPVTARAAGVKDQACLTSLLVGLPTHMYRRLACWWGWGRDHWPSWNRVHYRQHCHPQEPQWQWGPRWCPE